MPRNRSALIDAALLDAVAAHPRDLTRTVAEQLDISRQAVATRARALVEAGYLARSGTTRPTYVPGVRRRRTFTYDLRGLEEDRVWSRDVAPMLRDMQTNVVDIAHHGLTEMVNNAIGPGDYAFAKTVVPVRLAQVDNENLISRSQAKWLLQRVDQFRCVVLDFEDVSSIGQAFADEVFRVFANAHPNVELVPMHAVPDVQQMIRRAQVARERQDGQDLLQ